MSLPGRPYVEAEVIPTRRIYPLVSKQLLDVPDKPRHRQVPDVPDDPVERLPVSGDGRGRPPHLVARPLHKRGSTIPMVTGGGSSSPEAIGTRAGRMAPVLAKEILA